MKIKKTVFSIVICITILLVSILAVGCSKKNKEENVGKTEETDKTYIKKLPSQFNEGDSPIICVNKLNLEIL